MKQPKVVKKRRTPRDGEKTLAVKWTAQKFSVSTQYVYAVLVGSFNSGIADDIIKAFKIKYNELKSIMNYELEP